MIFTVSKRSPLYLIEKKFLISAVLCFWRKKEIPTKQKLDQKKKKKIQTSSDLASQMIENLLKYFWENLIKIGLFVEILSTQNGLGIKKKDNSWSLIKSPAIIYSYNHKQYHFTHEDSENLWVTQDNTLRIRKCVFFSYYTISPFNWIFINAYLQGVRSLVLCTIYSVTSSCSCHFSLWHKVMNTQLRIIHLKEHFRLYEVLVKVSVTFSWTKKY